MPRDLLRSARHATAGFLSAYRGERNVRLFLLGYFPVMLLGFSLQLSPWEWLALLLAGGLFLSVELLNTALEHLANILDDHLKAAHCTHSFEDMKAAKDVAAGASLVSLIVVIVTVVMVFSFHPQVSGFSFQVLGTEEQATQPET